MCKLALASASTTYVYYLNRCSPILLCFDKRVLHHDLSPERVLSVTDNEQSRDQNNPNWKVSTVTAWDDDRPPIGVLDFATDADREADTWLFRESSGQVDVMLRWPEGPFAKTIAGKVAFPWGKNYLSGGSKYIRSDHLRLMCWSAY
jgi:hypothetical protein